ITLIQPASATSVLSIMTFAPSSFALRVKAATSSTPTYACQRGGDPGDWAVIIPPPVPSPTSIIVYTPAAGHRHVLQFPDEVAGERVADARRSSGEQVPVPIVGDADHELRV